MDFTPERPFPPGNPDESLEEYIQRCFRVIEQMPEGGQLVARQTVRVTLPEAKPGHCEHSTNGVTETWTWVDD